MKVSVIDWRCDKPGLFQDLLGRSASITKVEDCARFAGAYIGRIYEIDETDWRYLTRFGDVRRNTGSRLHIWNTSKWDEIEHYFTRVQPRSGADE